MITVRKENKVLVYGDYECINEEDENLFLYRRWDTEESYIVLLNFSNSYQTVEHNNLNLDTTQIVISNYIEPFSTTQLRPWEAQLRRY